MNIDTILAKIKNKIPKKLFILIQPVYHFLLALIAAVVYHFPSEKIIVIGITGTTGKTTSVYLIAKTLEKAGLKVGFTSTAILNDGKKEWLNSKKMTMIGRFFTQKIIKEMVNNGCQVAIIETTSEGIKQFRHRFINYDILVFTGLYPEHIESHGSFENYKKAKGELFKHLKRCRVKYLDENNNVCKINNEIKKIDLKRLKKTIIVNGDDEHYDYFLNFWAEQKFVYTQKDTAFNSSIKAFHYGNIEASQYNTCFAIERQKICLSLLGSFNASNAMNAYCVAKALDIDDKLIKCGLESVKGVAGRLEKIDEGQDFTVIVDYAFEPGAVSKLYEVVKLIKQDDSRIIHVLGSTGGGRDVARRPKLGELAGSNANIVIVTNEDPYDDDPELIIDQVALGAERVGKKKGKNLFKILDRRKAIKEALSQARTGDIVLITGKGSEQAICVAGGEKISWDDRKVVREILKEMRSKNFVTRNS